MSVSAVFVHSTFHTEIVSVVTGGNEMVVVVICETNTVVVVSSPRVWIDGHNSMIVLVTGSWEIVLDVDRDQGGRTNVHGGTHAIVGSGSVRMLGSI